MAGLGRVPALDHSWVEAASAAGAAQCRGLLQQILEPAFAQPGALRAEGPLSGVVSGASTERAP